MEIGDKVIYNDSNAIENKFIGKIIGVGVIPQPILGRGFIVLLDTPLEDGSMGVVLFEAHLQLLRDYFTKEKEEESNRCVHTEHCCVFHGCKYGDDDCPVENGTKKQSYPCEDCDY